ncbi:MAG: CopG family transcriptional regulator [Scytonema sp. RU_4_4]|nr:CopG family transcriptional regulator [Scytonema sp. RU_4_4]NJR74086.1 CopG family transcriptional regulator [Scytonema sp. CRU_2_7]
MSTKKRKPLDDALASEFVYGETALREGFPPQATALPLGSKEQPEPQDEQEPEQETVPVTKPAAEPTSTQPTKSNLMSQLQPTTPKEATVRLTVDLPESMHRKLSVLAAKTGRKKAEIVRFLLDEALKEVGE